MSQRSNVETLQLLERIHLERKPESFMTLCQIYQRHGVNTPKSCLDEIRLDGSNTIVNILRGWEGVDYDEIVADVAEKIGVPSTQITNNYQTNELLILGKITSDYWSHLTPEERSRYSEQLGKLGDQYFDPTYFFNLLKLGANFIPLLLKIIGMQATKEVVKRSVQKMVIAQAAKQGEKYILGNLIPFVNIFMNLWFLNDIAGPAFRKTIPTVTSIALLRLQAA